MLLDIYTQSGGEDDPVGVVQDIEIRPYEQTVYAQPRICPGEWGTKTPLGFWDSNGSLNPD